ncbi:MAG: ABC transporter substrate-binding protein [Cellulosilyticaceae bacterium]
MKKFARKFSIMMVVGAMGISTLAGCGSKDTATDTPSTSTENQTNAGGEETKKSTYDTMVVGCDEMNGVFSPFFGTTGPDNDVTERVVEALIGTDRGGAPVSELADFTFEEVPGADGKVEKTVYTFKLKDGATFSDGKPVTADDIIFTYKVLSDPTYDGPSTIFTTPIIGINEYRYDDANYAGKIEELKAQSQNVTDDEIKAYLATYCAGDYDSYGEEAIIDYLGGKVDGIDGLSGDAKKTAIVDAYAKYEFENAYDTHKASTIDGKYKALEKEYIKSNLASGTANVPDISGIKKVDEQTVEVTITGVDPKAIWNLGGIKIAPAHYYAPSGLKKGDLAEVRAQNNAPMGSGPYKFEKFENNIVTLRANETYHKGAPKVPSVKIQVVAKANKLDSIQMKTIDVSDPNANPETLQKVKDAGLHYELIDNLGYGYIGLNADRITDKNVRKGLMHLMNRKPAVETYYGELASVIERPMSRVSWAYPEDAQEVYPFDPAKALECFEAAGYKQENGKLMKDGKQLKYEVGIAGDGTMDHPAAPVLTQMKTELEKLGGILEINDCDGTILFDRLNAGDWDMWVAAWQATVDPDMYQVYHSQGPSNHYKIKDAKLDQLIADARSTNDVEVRKDMYSQALDIIMDEAVEMPVYQRKNMFVFNPEVINVDTLAKDQTPFYSYWAEIQTLELK